MEDRCLDTARSLYPFETTTGLMSCGLYGAMCCDCAVLTLLSLDASATRRRTLLSGGPSFELPYP